jgi:LacI family transcriptional regulator
VPIKGFIAPPLGTDLPVPVVPGRIAVMGFDNWELFTSGARPRLSSVDINLEGLGRAAARRLFAAIGGDHAGGVQHLPCRLVTRETT